jgi:hypothetical protein
MLPAIAMLTMLIDHIGLIFFPENVTYRINGRIAFPLYCWLLAQGYRYTSSHVAYMKRLFVLACISQIPFILATGVFELNVIFTLLISLFALYALEQIRPIWLKVASLLAAIGAAIWIPMDYGIYGLILVFVYHYFPNAKLLVGHVLVEVLFWSLYGTGYEIQLFSLMGSLLIVSGLPSRLTPRFRLFYRSFYPLHLALLYLIYLGLQFA